MYQLGLILLFGRIPQSCRKS